VVEIRRTDTCGLLLVAGSAPPSARRVVLRSGRVPAQRARLRSVARVRDQNARWAALVRTGPTTAPPVTATAYDEHDKVIGRAEVPPGPTVRCRAGLAIPTTSTTAP
jgi:hypothetical protein